MMDNSGFSFEPFYLNIKRQCLQKHAEDVKTSARMFKLLHILAKASPEPVSKEELNRLLWPNTVVSEWSIARLVSDTRLLLGDDGEQQKFIQTARGYGFCMPDVVCHKEKPITKKVLYRKYFPLSLFAIALLTSLIFYWHSLTKSELKNSITKISQHQAETFTAFKAQLQRRNQLAGMLEKRLKIKKKRQWEMFFSYYYPQMNAEELFVCAQIRAITSNGLFQNNQAIFNELKNNPEIYSEVLLSKELKLHLNFWLNKYNDVFMKREDMCLLYVGVEDNIPYPSGIDENIKNWLASN